MKYITAITAIICALIIWWALLLVQDNKQDSIERQAKAKIELEQNKLDMEQEQIEQEKIEKETNAWLLKDCLEAAEEAVLDYAEINGSKKEDGSIWATNDIWARARSIQDRSNEICFKKYK